MSAPAHISADLNCPHCGPVILCPHKLAGEQSTGTRPHITTRGPGRCTKCSFHVETQGHREGCSGTARVEPAEDKPRSFLDRLARDAADDPSFYASCGAPIKRMADQLRAEAVAV
jgi:hypothetical protein